MKKYIRIFKSHLANTERGLRLRRVLLFFSLVLTFTAAGEARAAESHASQDFLGKPLEDFSVKTIDKNTFTLSETLKEKDLVMINLWASWCGPCEREFPAMERAYEKYKDRVAVLALSVYPKDSDEILKEYADSHGMTFSIGRDEGGKLVQYLGGESIPKTIIIDRYGNIAFFHNGCNDSTSAYCRIFDYFLSDDYAETKVLTAIPEQKMPKAVSSEELSAAANGTGSRLVFENLEEDGSWPMLPVKKDGRKGLVSSNVEVASSSSGVVTIVNASEGDALAFDFATSTFPMGDALQVRIDGKLEKCFADVHDWTSWALPLSKGSHEVSFSFVKTGSFNGSEDCIWISNVRLVSGQEAEKALAALPVYPVGDKLASEVLLDQAKYIELEFGDKKNNDLPQESICLVPEETENVPVRVSLPASMDPEMMAVSMGSGLDFHSLSHYLSEDGSHYELNVDFDEDDANHMNNVLMFYSIDEGIGKGEENSLSLTFLQGKKGLNSYIGMYREEGYSITGWHYVD